jgi:hypothetical protein
MNDQKQKKRAPFLPFPSNSLGNPQIRPQKSYRFSVIFREEKSGAAKSPSTWTWSGFAGTELRPCRRYAQRGGRLPGVDDGHGSNRMSRKRAIWRPSMPPDCLLLASGATTLRMGKIAHLVPQQPMEPTGPNYARQTERSRILPPRPHHSVTINQQDLP